MLFLTFFLPFVFLKAVVGRNQKVPLDKIVVEASLSNTLRNKILPLPEKKRNFHPVESTPPTALSAFQKHGRAHHKYRHHGYFYIRMQDQEKLEKMILSVATPSSPMYAQYYTREEISELAFDPNSHNHVVQYLEGKGFSIHDFSPYSGIIHASGPIHLWESELNTQFFEYSLNDSKERDVRLVRAESYSLSEDIIHHVSFVLNVVSFPLPTEIVRSSMPKRTTISNADIQGLQKPEENLIDLAGKPFYKGFVTPALLNTFYDIRNNTGSCHVSQAVYETIGQTFSPSDLSLFQNFFGLPVEKVTKVIGGHASNNACLSDHGNNCIEANLDIQYLMAVGNHISTIYYYWGEEDFMLAWLNTVVAMSHPPQIFSISYGADEAFIAESYAVSFNQVAIRLGLMGVTLVASSGDDGAVSTSARTSPLHCGYAPSFPASSPYVVAVGGTMGPEDGTAEVACQGDKNGIITSGGGFSKLYGVPSWQRSFTNAYLNVVKDSAIAPVSGYAVSGRGIPDISLLAHNYIIGVANNFTAVSGTSASSPVFAGMLGLINSARYELGLNPVGWILPALYEYAQEYVWDITEGHNRCAASGLVCCAQGFFATTGWDPVTGLGSLNFTSFKDSMIRLGSTTPSLSPTFLPGAPTPAPSTVPVVHTASPSLAPVFSNGYIRVLEYTGTDCSGTVSTVSGASTGVCLPEYDQSGSVIGAVKYSCHADGATLTAFSSSTCRDADKLEEQSFGFGCAYRVSTDYYGSDFYSVSVDCIEGTTATAILDGLDGRYALQKSYDSTSGCIAGLESSILAVAQDHCFPVEDQGFSYTVNFPTVKYYESLDCSGRIAQTETLNTECAALSSDSGSSGYSYGSAGSSSSSSWGVRRMLKQHHSTSTSLKSKLNDDYYANDDLSSSSSLSSTSSSSAYYGGTYAYSYDLSSSGGLSGNSLSSSISDGGGSDSSSDSLSSSTSITSELASAAMKRHLDSEATVINSILAQHNSMANANSQRNNAVVDEEDYGGSYSQGTVDLFAIWSDHTVHSTHSTVPSIVSSISPSLFPTFIPSTAASVLSSMPVLDPNTIPTAMPIANSVTNTPTETPTVAVSMLPTIGPSKLNDDMVNNEPTLTPTMTMLSNSPTVTSTVRPTAVQPTLKPTAVAPISLPTTLMPTLVNGVDQTEVVVVVSQFLSSVDQRTWTTCGASCVTVWLSTLTDILPAVSTVSTNVHVLTALDTYAFSSASSSSGIIATVPTSSLRTVSSLTSVMTRTASITPSSALLNITYVLRLPPNDWSATSNQETYEAMKHLLTQAIQDGSFEQRMHFHAMAHQTIPLLTAKVTTIYKLNPTLSSIDDVIARYEAANSDSSESSSSSSSDELSSHSSFWSNPSAVNTLIAFLVIGSVSMTGCILYYCCCGKPSKQQSVSSLFKSAISSRGKNSKAKGSLSYIQLSLGGDSVHGSLRRNEEDDDVEIVEFNGATTQRDSNAFVVNPVLLQSNMIQSSDDVQL